MQCVYIVGAKVTWCKANGLIISSHPHPAPPANFLKQPESGIIQDVSTYMIIQYLCVLLYTCAVRNLYSCQHCGSDCVMNGQWFSTFCNPFPNPAQPLPRIQTGFIRNYLMTHVRILGNDCPWFENHCKRCIRIGLADDSDSVCWASAASRSHFRPCVTKHLH